MSGWGLHESGCGFDGSGWGLVIDANQIWTVFLWCTRHSCDLFFLNCFLKYHVHHNLDKVLKYQHYFCCCDYYNHHYFDFELLHDCLRLERNPCCCSQYCDHHHHSFDCCDRCGCVRYNLRRFPYQNVNFLTSCSFLRRRLTLPNSRLT